MSDTNQIDGGDRGAYGFRLVGLPEGAPGLTRVPADWPELRIEQEPQVIASAPPPAGSIIRERNRAELWLIDGDRIELTRSPLMVRFVTQAPLSPDAILHPYLGLPAAFAAQWLGRHALHGGAFVHRRRAIAVLGERGAGKSATLGSLMARGIQVLSDDIVIVSGLEAFAGPRSIDLRADAAAIIGGEDLGVLGARPRWRLRPPAAPASMPLGGILTLGWGEEVSLIPLSNPGERLMALVVGSVSPPEPDAALALLELAALPAWRFVRPPRLGELDALVEHLLDALDACYT